MVLMVVLALLVPASANASELIGRNATNISMKVDSKGRALLTYNSLGKKWNVLAWGAVDADHPRRGAFQRAFKLDYAGGWGINKTNVAKTFKNTCGPYKGPKLAWFVMACTATDGSHWAIQSWQRELPNYGATPGPGQSVWELRLSHWTTELPVLTVNMNWAYRKFDHMFGSFTYLGKPVHGYKAKPNGEPLDTWGRNLYVDTFNSAYGRGWKRENSFLMHVNTGAFCYGFYPHGRHPVGSGTKYRATIIGPGLMPDIMWEGRPLGAYDQPRDLSLHAEQKTFFGSLGDGVCKAV